MVHEVVRTVARQPSSLVLVASSIVSAVAAVAGLDLWVSLLAAVAAVISGAQVVRRDIVVPLRINRVTEATAVVQTSPETGGAGTAVQVRPGVWLMSAYLPTEDCYQLLLDGGWRLAHVLRRNDNNGLLLLGCAHKTRWVAGALTSNIPSQGDPVGVVDWTTGLARPIRIRQDYIAQALTSDQQLGRV